MKGVELSQILRLEQTPILGKRVFEVLFRPPLLQQLFGKTHVSIFSLDDTMFESGRFGEEEHLSLLARSFSPEPSGKASETKRSQAGAHKHVTPIYWFHAPKMRCLPREIKRQDLNSTNFVKLSRVLHLQLSTWNLQQ